jgi:hypothetical protein
MKLLADKYDDNNIFAATIPCATALGAAIALHQHWNNKQLPENLIRLKLFN